METVVHKRSVLWATVYGCQQVLGGKTLALEIRLRELGLAMWEKNQGWPLGNSLEGLEFRANATEDM